MRSKGTESATAFWPWATLALAAALRLVGIAYGLPAVFNADEPHHINVALAFGSGDLNPHFFKYPTLWMYVLFLAYGLMFAIWSGLGLLHSPRDFGAFFAWHPGPFFLVGRLLSAAFSLGAVWRAHKTAEALWGGRAALVAALALAVAPDVVASAHAAKPECLMLFWAAWAWWFAVKHRQKGGDKNLILCGVFCGLAASTQYTALPLAVLVPAAAFARAGSLKQLRAAAPALLKACLAAPAAFFAGSPFLLLDWRSAWSTVADMRFMETLADPAHPVWRIVLRNITCFAGCGLMSATLIVGAVLLFLTDKRRAAFLMVPVAILAACLSRSGEGGWARYLFAVYPALAIVCAFGVETLLSWADWKFGTQRLQPSSIGFAIVFLALGASGAARSAALDRDWLLPDTRTLAKEWIETTFAPGSKVLLDQRHASPDLAFSRDEVAALVEQTRATHNPRQRLYELMLASHPGGGYWVYRLLRDPADLHTLPGHAAVSAQGQPMLDAREGLSALKREGVRYVVLSDVGATPERSPELKRFFMELGHKGELLATFEPVPGKVRGPKLSIFEVKGT